MKSKNLPKKYLDSYKKYCMADLQRSLQRTMKARDKAELRIVTLLEVLRIRIMENEVK
jgi:hypothetical protein